MTKKEFVQHLIVRAVFDPDIQGVDTIYEWAWKLADKFEAKGLFEKPRR